MGLRYTGTSAGFCADARGVPAASTNAKNSAKPAVSRFPENAIRMYGLSFVRISVLNWRGAASLFQQQQPRRIEQDAPGLRPCAQGAPEVLGNIRLQVVRISRAGFCVQP